MKIAALFSLASGAILEVVRESLHWHDARLFRRLGSALSKGDIILGDRAFADFVSLAQLPAQGIDLICRLHQARKVDFRRCECRLGVKDVGGGVKTVEIGRFEIPAWLNASRALRRLALRTS
jgi:hypothetical protein